MLLLYTIRGKKSRVRVQCTQTPLILYLGPPPSGPTAVLYATRRQWCEDQRTQ